MTTGQINIYSHEPFIRWMNRPLNRAQVFTFKLACAMFPDDLSLRFRCRPAYRGELELRQRKQVSDHVRFLRSLKPVPLPIYNLATGRFL